MIEGVIIYFLFFFISNKIKPFYFDFYLFERITVKKKKRCKAVFRPTTTNLETSVCRAVLSQMRYSESVL